MAKGCTYKWLWPAGQTLAFKRQPYSQAVYVNLRSGLHITSETVLPRIIFLKSSVCDRLNSSRRKSPHLLTNPQQNWPPSWCAMISSSFDKANPYVVERKGAMGGIQTKKLLCWHCTLKLPEIILITALAPHTRPPPPEFSSRQASQRSQPS